MGFDWVSFQCTRLTFDPAILLACVSLTVSRLVWLSSLISIFLPKEKKSTPKSPPVQKVDMNTLLRLHNSSEPRRVIRCLQHADIFYWTSLTLDQEDSERRLRVLFCESHDLSGIPLSFFSKISFY